MCKQLPYNKHLNKYFRNLSLEYKPTTDNSIYKYFLVKYRFVFYHKTFPDDEYLYNICLGKYMNYRNIRDFACRVPELKF